MTDNEIRELVSEYTDELYRDEDTSDFETQENKETVTTICQYFLGHVLDRYCIVSREKIKKWSEESEFTAFDSIDLIEIFDDLFGQDIFTDKDEKQ